MKRYLLVVAFDGTSTIHYDISVAIRFENLISSSALSTRNLIANGIKQVWVIDTDFKIEDILKNILTQTKEDPIFRNLKMIGLEYFEIKSNKVIL